MLVVRGAYIWGAYIRGGLIFGILRYNSPWSNVSEKLINLILATLKSDDFSYPNVIPCYVNYLRMK